MTLEYPKTERVASNVSTGEMWREAGKPLFLLLFVCMWMTAAAELGPDQWFPLVMGALVPQLQGVLFLVYTAGLMFLLRFYGSGIAHKAPIATLVVCSLLTAVGLYWLGGLQPGASPVVAFAAATVFGVGKTYFWPTMLGVTAEQFPRGGALLLSFMGGAGMLSVAVALPIMGARIDRFGPGAALQYVAMLGVVLAVIFGAMFAYFAREAATGPSSCRPGCNVPARHGGQYVRGTHADAAERTMKVACLVAAHGVWVLSAQQPPQVARLTGEAPPPASPLSLWYRAPASDRPMDPPRPTGEGANQEWVRALPVGNGRLGAMVFGGVGTRTAAAQRRHVVGRTALTIRSTRGGRRWRFQRSDASSRPANIATRLAS